MGGLICGLAGLLILAVPAVSLAQSNMAIYSDANGLVNGWHDAGYNGTALDNASVYSGGGYFISVGITNGYAGIEFLHDPMADASFGSISFWLNGGPSGGQYLEMYGILLVNGVQAPQAARYLLSRPAANTWQQYTVPLSRLGVATVTNFAGFAIQDRANGSEPVFYLDDIQLLDISAPPPSPRLTVNASQPIRTADPRWFGIGTAIWDEYIDTPQTLTLLTNMGATTLRFPGGSASDQFHWFNNTNVAGNPPFAYGPTLASFIHVVTNLNAQTMITVNYGTGTPSEAAAWVAYVNATTNNPQYLGLDSYGIDWHTAGYWASVRASTPTNQTDPLNFLRISRTEPLGFKYWEIGNESFGYWETDNNFAYHDPYTYAVRAQKYIWLMKAVDPTIKIGVVVVPGVSNYVNNRDHTVVNPADTNQSYNGWTPVLLATLAGLDVTPDFAITHWYPENPTYENDTLLLETPMGSASPWATNAADLRGQISEFMGAKGTNMELICTENNSDVAQPGKQSVSLVNGLYKADTLGQLMQTEFNGLFWHDFRDAAIEFDGNMDSALYGWRLYGDFGVATDTNLYPTYYTTKLIQHFAQGGDMVVAAASDDSLLSIYAVRRQDGSLTLLAINKDPLNTNTAQVSVAGFTPASSVTVYSYGIPQDFAAQVGIGSQDISTNNISVTGTTFTNSFPPYSATVMVLSPASTGSSTTTVTSSQNPALAGSGVTFTAGVTGSGGIPTGYVVFYEGATNLGIRTLNSSGVTSLTTATLSVGGSPHSIAAVYSGDSSFSNSASSVLLQSITNKTGVSTNGLSASWAFSEGSGATVADSSGNGNTGTLYSSGNGNPGTLNYSPVWVTGLNGSNALQFPGAYVPGAAYVSAPDSVTLADQGIGSNITLCAWVKRSSSSIGNYSAVLAKDTPFDTFPYHRNYEILFYPDNRLLFAYRNSVGTSWEFYASSNAYADVGNWHFYCVTYTYGNSNSCTLYVDGAPVSGSWIAGNGSDAPASTSGGPVLIGIDGTGTSSYGSTYEGISIYSVPLSGGQVFAHYINGLTTGVATSTGLKPSPASPSAGSVVTYTATVSGSGSGTPTGTVVFFDGNSILGTGTLNSNGVAGFSTIALSDNGLPHSIIAIYEGGGVFAGSSSDVLSLTFASSPSTSTLSSSQNPALAGNVVTFTATVSGSNGIPSGTVVFYDGTNNLGSGTLSNGVVSFSTSALSASGLPHSITADYSGDSTFIGSTSGVLSQIINFDPSTTTLSSTNNPALAASVVTFTAKVSGSNGTPTGTVAFYDGTNNLGSGTLSNGVASFSTNALSVSGSPHSITANYGGDSTFSNSASGVLLQTIILRSSTTMIGSSQNPALAASVVTFTATVSGSGITPTGTVLFRDGTNNLGSGTLNSNGVASFSTNALSVSGSPHSITAVYGGDSTFSNSTSGVLSQIINFRPSTNTLSSTNNPALAASVVTFTATVSGSGITPTGTVVFYDGTNNLGSGTLNSNGVASFSTNALSVSGSPHSITAVYGGDSTFSNSASGVLLQTIILRPSTNTISSSQNPALAASVVIFMATVSGSGITPTGTVVFYDGTNNLGSGTLSNGVAIISTTALSVSGSPHTIGATYGGDNIFSSSTSGVLSQIINFRPSTNTLGSTNNPALAASVVTFKATVSGSGGTPTGTVVFFDGTNNLGSGTLNSNGEASISNGPLSVSGSPHSIGAFYGGDNIFSNSTSGGLSQIINFRASTTTIGSSQNPSAAGSAVTFTATVSGSGSTPTGTVVFYDGSNNLGSGTLNSSGMASLSTSALSVSGSPHTMKAVYGGDSTFSNSTSGVLSQLIAFRPSTNTISSSQNPAVARSAVTFTATVSGSNGTPTGTVVFYDDVTNNLGSAILNSNGVASFGTSALSVSGSPHSITAAYGGDSTFIGSTSGALSQIINFAPSTNTIISSQNPAGVGSAVTFTATVSGSGGTPTGTVLFNDGTNNLGSGTLNSNGAASFSTSALSVNGSPHSMLAVYGGDNAFSGSTSDVLLQLIAFRPSTNTISSSQNPARAGGVLTFTATVSGSGGTPTGTVVFYDGTNNLGSGALNSNGMASLSTSALSVGGSPHSVTAVYGGDSTFIGSTSRPLSQIINFAPSTSTITSSQNPAAARSAVTFTATVSGSGGPPTGTVVFYDGTNNLGSGALNSSGVASFSTSALAVSGSPHSIAAVYGGDNIFSNSASGLLSQIIILATSTTTISSSQNPSAAGSEVTFTATVSGSGGPPTGTVIFYVGTNNLGTGTLDSSGVASASTGLLAVNGSPHSIAAVYSGDSSFSNSISSVLLQIITNGNAGADTNGLSASWPFKEGFGTTVADSSGNGNTGTLINSPLWVGGLAGNNALEFPASSGAGPGYVSVPDSTTLGDQGIGSNITICAWVQRSAASLGNYCSVVAKDILYDSPPYHRNYELIFDSGGHLLFIFMNSTGSGWQIYSSSAVYTDTANWHFYCVTYTYGSAASCTLYVDGVAVPGGWIAGNGSDAPASTSGGPVLIGTDGTGTAANGSFYDQISIYNVVLSAPRVFALYNGGTSDPIASTTVLTSSQNPASAGSAVTFMATVSGSGGAPTGTVVFYDGTNNLGSGTLNSSGVATFGTGALLVSGSPHSMTAVYSGDSAFSGSTSIALLQIIAGSTNVAIPLVNPSFEFPAGAPDTVAGTPWGWFAANGSSAYGVYNPPDWLYQNEVNDVLPVPAQGSQVLFIQGGNYLAQFLTNTLAPNQTYTLSGAIGNRVDGYGLFASDDDYVALLAGGAFIAQNANLPHPAPGTFLPWSITYTTGAAGFPSGTLEIRLGQNGAGQVHYDNITLTTTSTIQVAQDPPVITAQPTNQTVPAGSSPSFSVAAAGSEPFGYQWFFAGANLLQSGTNNTLTLSSVLANNAGNYRVVVTNFYGSTTSAVAALLVTIPLTPPRILVADSSFGFLTNRFGFYLGGAFGQTIVVDGSANLTNWTPLFTNTVGGNPFYFADPASATLPWRFYRARLP